MIVVATASSRTEARDPFEAAEQDTRDLFREILRPSAGADRGCVEIRVFDADFVGSRPYVCKGGKYLKTINGYFDDEDAFVAAAKTLRGASGYVTLNPVKPDLLARANNRLIIGKDATKDVDVVAYDACLVDIDVARPKGISTTDEECAAAIARRDQILRDHPDLRAGATWGCSGNGAWIRPRLGRLPNDGATYKLVGDLLASLAAQYDDPIVSIDVSTKNPSRVMALAGTLKCKGDSTPDRPWRLATIDGGTDSDQTFDIVDWLKRFPPPTPAATDTPKATTTSRSTDQSVWGMTASSSNDAARFEAYARSALENECRTVAGTQNERNNQLFVSAASIGELVGAGVIGEAEASEALASAARESGLEEREITATIRSGLETGKKKPRDLSKVENKNRANGTSGPESFRQASELAGSRRIGEQVDDPHCLANGFLAENFTVCGELLLRYYRGEFYRYDKNCYVIYRDHVVDLTYFIKEDYEAWHILQLEIWKRKGAKGKADEKPPILPKVTVSAVKNVTQAVQSETAVDSEQEIPFWTGDQNAEWADRSPLDILPAKNVLVHLPTLQTLKHTSRLFTPFSLDYDWQDDPPQPLRFLQFLAELFPGDPAAVREIAKWFGYSLTQDTTLQRILMIIGPPGSGKGTLLRILTALVGKHNTANPSLPGLARPFGLWPLINKSLCIFSDAHALGSSSDRAIVLEQLLKISGEDDVTIDRKFQQPITCKLNARLVFVGNQVPNLRDPSGALMRRIAPIRLTQSFTGTEKRDGDLTNKLLAELPGILRHFAVPGLAMLRQDKDFFIPESAKSLLTSMSEVLNPVGVFADECLELVEGDDREMQDLPLKRDVFSCFCEWCKDTKHEPSSNAVFGRNLRSVKGFDAIVDVRETDGRREWHYRGLKFSVMGEELRKRAIWRMAVSASRGNPS